LERDATCVTFRCKTIEDSPRFIFVKFVQTYGDEVHKLLASRNIAPQLLYYGCVDKSQGAPSYQGLQMAVMDFIDGKTVTQVKDNLPSNFEDQVQHHLSSAPGRLCVWRSTRAQCHGHDGRKSATFDFNFAGKAGEVKYPIHLSTNGSIIWSQGVVALGNLRRSTTYICLKASLRRTRSSLVRKYDTRRLTKIR
jgi:hypothetical protein